MADESTSTDLVGMMHFAEEVASRRDLEAVISAYAADAALDVSSFGLGVYEGRAAIRGFYGDVMSAYEEFNYTDIDDARAAADRLAQARR